MSQDRAWCPDLVRLPPGQFLMGSPHDENGRLDVEGPQHLVTIERPFAIGRHPVTVDQFAAFVADSDYGAATTCRQWTGADWEERPGSFRSPGFAQAGDHPVVCVSWEDAQAYVRWLSSRTGLSVRLPSEAEWEYAARAGTTTPYWWGTSIAPGQANFKASAAGDADCSGAHWRQHTVSVRSFEPNPWGIHQVHGNVWEWIEDGWSPSYANAPLDGSARLEAASGKRGPAWRLVAERTAWRSVGAPPCSRARLAKKRYRLSHRCGNRALNGRGNLRQAGQAFSAISATLRRSLRVAPLAACTDMPCVTVMTSRARSAQLVSAGRSPSRLGALQALRELVLERGAPRAQLLADRFGGFAAGQRAHHAKAAGRIAGIGQRIGGPAQQPLGHLARGRRLQRLARVGRRPIGVAVERRRNNASLFPKAAYRLGRLMPMASVSSASEAPFVALAPEHLQGTVQGLVGVEFARASLVQHASSLFSPHSSIFIPIDTNSD